MKIGFHNVSVPKQRLNKLVEELGFIFVKSSVCMYLNNADVTGLSLGTNNEEQKE